MILIILDILILLNILRFVDNYIDCKYFGCILNIIAIISCIFAINTYF